MTAQLPARAAWVLLTAAWLGCPSAAMANGALEYIADSLAQDSTIEHLPPSSLTDTTANPATPEPLLFDVREAGEYAVSHIPRAVNIDPQISAEAFLARYGTRLSGRTAVFYCSTGRRSTALAERIRARLEAHDKHDIRIANLYGGIFHWHDRTLPLVDATGPTRRIHPYNWAWKWLLEQPGMAAYQPE